MKQIRNRLTYANVMSSIAIFFILGGATAFATAKLGKNSVGTKQLKNNSVTTAKIKNAAVTGAKINLGSLGTVPNATNAANATNASQLGGIPASGYTRNDCNSLTGQIKGFARINNASVSTGALSTAGVEIPYNCSGQTVLARRFSTGKYEVQFSNSPVGIALATPLEVGNSSTWDVNSASVERVGSGDFFIQIWNDPTSTFLNDSFAILTP